MIKKLKQKITYIQKEKSQSKLLKIIKYNLSLRQQTNKQKIIN